MLTDEERQELRKAFGETVIDVQERFKSHGPDVVVPELISALLSLAWYISTNNADMSRDVFLMACAATTAEDDG